MQEQGRPGHAACSSEAPPDLGMFHMLAGMPMCPCASCSKLKWNASTDGRLVQGTCTEQSPSLPSTLTIHAAVLSSTSCSSRSSRSVQVQQCRCRQRLLVAGVDLEGFAQQ